jgi:hypothetical protein
MSELRQRGAAKPEDKEDIADKPSVSQLAKDEDSAFSLLDVARTLVFLLLLSAATSYFITRESFTWNLDRPKWSRPEVIQAWLVRPIPLHNKYASQGKYNLIKSIVWPKRIH